MATKYLDYAGLAHVIEKLIKRQFQGKGLSTEDFTTALKNKLSALPTTFVSQSDVTALQTKVTALERLIESDSDGAINKFNEIVAFLANITDTDTLQGLLADIASQISNLEQSVTAAGRDFRDLRNQVNTNKEAIISLNGRVSDIQDYLTDNVLRRTDIVSITNAEIDALIAAGGVVS